MTAPKDSAPDSAAAPDSVDSADRASSAGEWLGGRPYPNDFKPDSSAARLRELHGEKTREALQSEAPQVRVAGRVMLRRVMGKAAFFTVRDGSGETIQVYAVREILGAKIFAAAAHSLHRGDIIGCTGEIFKTRTGELTVRARELRILSKCLLPLPEKHAGLADPEERRRRRYLSLIVNPEERRVFETRARTIRWLREFLHARDYVEVETPILQSIPGGALARPFSTHHNALGQDFYLRVAQELNLKRLIVGGFERVFELNRNFRNEGISARHNPEFTMLEYNAAYEDCESYMALTEEMLSGLVREVNGNPVLKWRGMESDFSAPFARMTPAEALREFCAERKGAPLDDADFLRRALGMESAADAARTVGELQLLLFEREAEHRLVHPVFIAGIPSAASPLARRSDANPEVAERFELFAAGRELVNGFSELNDPSAQDAILREQAKRGESGDLEAMFYDEDYVRALRYGLPPNAGGGIGIDRLVMLLTDQPSIRDVILFPQMRTEGGGKS